MSKRLPLFAGLVLAASSLAFYVATGNGHHSTTGQTPQAASVPVVACVGYVEPNTEVRRLAFKIDGIIARTDAEIGRSYRKGDVLIMLDDRVEAASVAVAAAGLVVRESERDKVLSGTHPALVESVEASVHLLTEQLRFSRADLARLEPLLAKNSTTVAEFDRMFTQVQQSSHRLAVANAELASLKKAVRPEDVRVAEARILEARELLGLARQRVADTTLRAPIDGVVLEVLRREGEAARIADPEPAVLFADTSRLRVRIEVDDRHVAALAVGQKAVVSGRGLGDRSYLGRISLVKAVMGKKAVFTRAASERKDLDVVQAFVETDEPIVVPVGLEVDVVVSIDLRPLGHR